MDVNPGKQQQSEKEVTFLLEKLREGMNRTWQETQELVKTLEPALRYKINTEKTAVSPPVETAKCPIGTFLKEELLTLAVIYDAIRSARNDLEL